MSSDTMKAPPGHIIDDTGAVRRLLGTLALTADGCVPGVGAELWLLPRGDYPQDPARMRVNNPDHFQRMYSSREAAIAARDFTLRGNTFTPAKGIKL